MDVRNINKFFVAGDNSRSATTLDPNGTTYLSKGELVITSEDGSILSGTDLQNNHDQFRIYLRSKNGEPVYRSQTLNKNDIKYAQIKQQKDTSHLAYFVNGFPSSPNNDTVYVIKVYNQEVPYYNPYSVEYRVDGEADGTALIENIATKVNDYFSSTDTPNVTSEYKEVDGTQALMIRGQDYDINLIEGETFDIPDFDTSVIKYDGSGKESLDTFNNLDGSVAYQVDGTDFAIEEFDRGSGTYNHVGSMEWHTRGWRGDNKITYPHHPYDIKLEVEDYDGSGYDLLTMHGVNRDTEGLGGNTSHPYQITIALPVANNTNQQNDIYTVLDNAIGVTGSLS